MGIAMALSLHISHTDVDGCIKVSMQSFKDHRGFFREQFNTAAFEEVGLPTDYPQDNISWSYKNVLRGLHMQVANPQGKLVSCPQGRIFDVCVDVRPNSPTFGKVATAEIGFNDALYCPPGTLHGFLALEDSMVYYKCTSLYDKNSDGGVYAMDPKLEIPWPKIDLPYVMSDKDMHLPTFEEFFKRCEWKTKA